MSFWIYLAGVGQERRDTVQRTWDPVGYVLSAGAATITAQQPRTSVFIMSGTGASLGLQSYRRRKLQLLISAHTDNILTQRKRKAHWGRGGIPLPVGLRLWGP